MERSKEDTEEKNNMNMQDNLLTSVTEGNIHHTVVTKRENTSHSGY